MSSKYPVQYETIQKTKNGWYAYRDLDGSGYAAYLFESIKDGEKIIIDKQWFEPICPTPWLTIALFKTKQDVIKALRKAVA